MLVHDIFWVMLVVCVKLVKSASKWTRSIDRRDRRDVREGVWRDVQRNASDSFLSELEDACKVSFLEDVIHDLWIVKVHVLRANHLSKFAKRSTCPL